jgi:hypothetical protein
LLTGGTHLLVHVIVFNLALLIARVTSGCSDSSPELIPNDPLLHLDAYPHLFNPLLSLSISPTYQYLRCCQDGEIAHRSLPVLPPSVVDKALSVSLHPSPPKTFLSSWRIS